MLEPLPRTQEELRRFCVRHERRLWFRRLLVYVPSMAPASVFSPAWVAHFFGVGFSFQEVITSGVCLWLVVGGVYVFADGVSLFRLLLCSLIWGAAFYLIGLLVCLYRCIRPLFPWEPKIEKAPEDAEAPETVLTHPQAARVVWEPGEDGTYRSAHFGIKLPTDGYYAFEIVVENPSAPIHAILHTAYLPIIHYQDKEETMELRSVYRFYGRFYAGLYPFHLFSDGTSEPDATVTQLV